MEKQLVDIDTRLAELAGTVQLLEARVAALEQDRGIAAAPASVPEAPSVRAPAFSAAGILPLAGRSFLVLAGAFLIRALTDAGGLPAPVGVSAGLGYALLWLALTDREAGRGRTLSAGFHGFVAILIAYPLLWESTVRFHALAPGLASLLVVAVTLLTMVIAGRHGLPALAWASSLTSLAVTGGLLVAVHAIVPLTGALVVCGIGAVWLGYARGWDALPWLPALGADLSVWLLVTLAAWPGGPPESYRLLSPRAALALALASVAAYLGSFAVHSLLQGARVGAFELAQTAIILYVGFGGALKAARVAGSGVPELGTVGIVLAGAAYAAAFALEGRRPGHERGFVFYSALGLVLALWGSTIVLPDPFVGLTASALGLACAVAARRSERPGLRAQADGYLAFGAVATGLAASVVDAFTAPSGQPWRSMAWPGVVTLVALLVASRVSTLAGRKAPKLERAAAVVLTLLSLLGLGGLVTLVLARLLPAGDAGALAALRSAVLAATAVVLAAAAVRAASRGRTALAYLALVAGGFKLLVEDLPRGRPATLFIAFVLYGCALLLVPSLLRRRPEPADPH